MNFMPKNAKKFHCEECDFSCSKESNWSNHLLTRKHQIRTNSTVLEQKNAKKCHKQYECHCGKIYTARNSWWYHKKKCVLTNTVSNYSTTHVSDTGLVIDKHTIMSILLQNKEMMTKMMEIIPSICNQVHTNSHNTTNNQFNIQMFLNEHCKNAMNLTDFIDSLPITASTYDSTIENGLTKTITNMITNGLNKLDILERPIHCTDATRKTLYVKESDIWEKDTELLKVVEGIKTLIRKKRTLISRWKEANIGWDTVENKQMRFTELICNIMTDVDFDEKETRKIVRSISKSVYLDSEDKKKYLC